MILDAKISPNGRLIAYCSQLCTKLFSLSIEPEGPPKLEPLPLPESITNVQNLIFSPDSRGRTIFFVKSSKEVCLYSVKFNDVVTFTIDLKGVVTLLDVSPCGYFLAVATTEHKVGIYKRTSKLSFGHHVNLPNYKAVVTAIRFHQKLPKLYVVYSDFKFIEYNYHELRFDFATVLSSGKNSTISPYHPIKTVLPHPTKENIFVIQTEMGVFSLKKLQEDEVEEEEKSRKKKKIDKERALTKSPIRIEVLKRFEVRRFVLMRNDEKFIDFFFVSARNSLGLAVPKRPGSCPSELCTTCGATATNN